MSLFSHGQHCIYVPNYLSTLIYRLLEMTISNHNLLQIKLISIYIYNILYLFESIFVFLNQIPRQFLDIPL